MGKKSPPSPPTLRSPKLSTIDLEALGELTNLDLGELSNYLSAFPEFLKQESNIGSLQNFSNTVNQSFKDSLEGSAPGIGEGLKSVSSNALSQLRGEIPQDIEDAIFRSAAFRDFNSGVGSRSGLSQNLTARDLGLTSLDLQNQGVNTLAAAMQGASAMNPVQAKDMLFSPADVLARMDANTAIQNQEEMFNTNLTNFRTIYNNDIENQERYYNTGIKNQQATTDTNVANANAMNRYNYDLMKYQQSGPLAGLGGALGTIAGGAIGFATGGPAGALAGASMGNAFGGGIQSAATGGGFTPLANGLVSGMSAMAGIGVNDQNPFGVMSAIGRSLGFGSGAGAGSTPIPRAGGINQAGGDPRLSFSPPAGSGRLSVTPAMRRGF